MTYPGSLGSYRTEQCHTHSVAGVLEALACGLTENHMFSHSGGGGLSLRNGKQGRELLLLLDRPTDRRKVALGGSACPRTPKPKDA